MPNVTQVGDMGIDGKLYPVNTKPTIASSAKTKHGDTGVGIFADDWYPIQVKQVDKVGRPDIDQFQAVMERENRQRGYFVAFGYTSDAEQEAAAFLKRTNRWIKPITPTTVQEILDEEHVRRM